MAGCDLSLESVGTIVVRVIIWACYVLRIRWMGPAQNGVASARLMNMQNKAEFRANAIAAVIE